jgi:hypothetical protein
MFAPSRLIMFFIIEINQILKQNRKSSRLPRVSIVQRREERFAKEPGAFERPGPAGQGAAALSHELARSVGVAVGIQQRGSRIQCVQIGEVAIPMGSVLLPAADSNTSRADDGRVFLNERRTVDKELFYLACLFRGHGFTGVRG